jgi:hypothetical protein
MTTDRCVKAESMAELVLTIVDCNVAARPRSSDSVGTLHEPAAALNCVF